MSSKFEGGEGCPKCPGETSGAIYLRITIICVVDVAVPFYSGTDTTQNPSKGVSAQRPHLREFHPVPDPGDWDETD